MPRINFLNGKEDIGLTHPRDMQVLPPERPLC
jgi:hypothetical protein